MDISSVSDVKPASKNNFSVSRTVLHENHNTLSNDNSSIAASTSSTPSCNQSDASRDNQTSTHLRLIEERATKLFPPSTTQWWMKQDLINELYAFAHSHGFLICQTGKSILCTRAREPMSDKRRRLQKEMEVSQTVKRKRTSIRCDCGFHLKYTSSKAKIAGSPQDAI